LISLIIFIIVDVFAAHSFPQQFYGAVMNTTSAVCIIYVLFLRTYMLLIKDKTISTNKKNFLMSSTYAIMTFNAIIAVMFYHMNMSPRGRIFTQIFTYTAALLMLGFTKYNEFKDRKLYGKVYTALTCIDILFIGAYLVVDYMVTPNDFVENHNNALFKLCLLFIPIMINNCIISYFKDYWLHKKVLVSKLTTKIKTNKERNLLIEGRDMYNSRTLREVAYVLDNAPIRLIEVAHIIKITHDIMIANKRSIEEAVEFSSRFGGIIYLQFMKRKYDFSMLFRPIVKLLQTYNKYDNNSRSIKLSI
jgi:hypothetical protein